MRKSQVALLIETARGFSATFCWHHCYSRLHGPWSFHITPGDYKQAVPKMKQWGGRGSSPHRRRRVAQAVIDANLPTIALGLTDEQMLPGSPLAPPRSARTRARYRDWRQSTSWRGS
jgi:LacI family transcriptional regulator